MTYSAAEIILHIAELSKVIAFQSGTSSSELAGQMLSALAANPKLIDRFMVEGGEMFLQDELGPEKGVLSWYGRNGQIVTPEFMRRYLKVRKLERDAVSAATAGAKE